MPTLFGTNRSAKATGQIASSEFAKITLGGVISLGQSVNGSYTRNIQTIFEIGNPNVYWLGGHEQGNLQMQRLVGKRGFFADIRPGACGEIKPVAINVTGGTCATGSGGLTIGDAILEAVSFGMQAGSLEITDGATLRFASLSRS